jgi:uncharacterized protein YggU (UPF0235/DUF167 family)
MHSLLVIRYFSGLMRILQIKVKPGARQSSLAEQPDGSWLASLKSPPVDGKANMELSRLSRAVGTGHG